jgi:hypothetical protein
MKISTIGLDIAKNVFQIHGLNEKDKVVVLAHIGNAPTTAP